MNKYLDHRAEIEFRNLISMKLIPIDYCTTTDQLKLCMEELHFVIDGIKRKYGMVPERASLMYARYISKYDRMVFEDFKREYAS